MYYSLASPERNRSITRLLKNDFPKKLAAEMFDTGEERAYKLCPEQGHHVCGVQGQGGWGIAAPHCAVCGGGGGDVSGVRYVSEGRKCCRGLEVRASGEGSLGHGG